MVVPMADFLAEYIHTPTGLPKPTYDLWEENFLTTTYTTSVTYAALLAAADLADLRNDNENAVKWRAVAERIRTAAEEHLYNEERKAFYKGIRIHKDGTLEPDPTIDMSSIFGSFMYGLFPIDSKQTKAAFETAQKVFNFGSDGVAGLPRYENDSYHRPEGVKEPNWWFVTTLWLAQYYLETGEHEKADEIVRWTRDSAWSTGVLAEQVNPKSREEVSVSPLNWSQAEYVSTLLDTITDK
jgi:GH15 family glucan-1,4-alpha-glucosidase